MKYLGPYVIEGELEKGSVSASKAREIGDKLKVDFSKVDLDEFRRGIEVEMEHSDTLGDGMETAAKVALDHLEEDPEYYTKLDKIHEEYRDERGRPSAAKRGYDRQWRKKRDEVIKRDKGKCTKCGKAVRGKFNKQVDHQTNRKKKSGHDGKSNLRLLCGQCHREKTARHDRK